MKNVNLKSTHVLPNILTAAGRDAWISVLFSIIPIIIMGLMIFYMSRPLERESLLSFLRNHYSSLFVKILAV
ncbi:GerAB/ArcD/ProY family transporter [Peribacillus muralis]|uniref:GerAB/ArcD/ProY family transporter n=1 Tax=Peribacillus muralis TaxID=264697 RepID=UPI0037F86FA3